MGGGRSPVTNEDILATLANGYSLAEVCKIKGISRTAVYARRKKDPEFDLQVTRLMQSPAHALKQKTREKGGGDDWRVNFIVWYRKSGSKETAANAVDKTPTEIEDHLNPESEAFDEYFKKLYEDELVRKRWAIEDNILRAAEEGKDRPSQRFLLERLDPEKYRQAPHRSEGNQTAILWFSGEGEAKAKNFLTGLFGERTKDIGTAELTPES